MNKMIIFFSFAIVLTICLLMISCEKERNIEATIIIDCTGTYLRISERDYKVCNLEKTENFTHEQIVKVCFKNIKDCDGSGNIPSPCFLYHPFETYVEIVKIK